MRFGKKMMITAAALCVVMSGMAISSAAAEVENMPINRLPMTYGEDGPDGGEGFDDRGGRGAGGDGMAVETDPAVLAVLESTPDKFIQLTYDDPVNGISLEYSLFIPDDYDASQKYPLIMFIPDATGAGKSARQIVEEYYGADIWATDAEQAKHPSFVIVPAFTGVVVNDSNTVSDQVNTALRLIGALVGTYSIDTDRIYTTGQSMGCMTSLYLNGTYPDLFAASLYVSGQWDVSILKPLEQQKFFYITAGGDERASGGQTDVMQMFDADGIPYTYAEWDAQLPALVQNMAVLTLIAQGDNANMVRFTTGSVLNGGEGMEHMASFNYAYKIEAVRDWLFAQSK